MDYSVHKNNSLWVFVAFFMFLSTAADPSLKNVIDGIIFHEKCLDELGCFSNGPPFFEMWQRPVSFLPDDRQSIGTTFQFFTRKLPLTPVNITISNRSTELLQRNDFRTHRKTVFIVPGFMSEYAPPWEEALKNALLKVGDYNVFTVGWTGGDGPLYEQAVANTRVVGAEIALFISFLEEHLGLNPISVHIIGHSLGAHIAGYTGKRIKDLGRITGLDPAGPYFENVNKSVRLDASDALFVDCIHSDKATSRFQGFGTTESIGTVDFFPNGGEKQPGCPFKYTAAWELLKNPLNRTDLYAIMCDHGRAIDLFISSIDNPGCPLLGSVCNTWDNYQLGMCNFCSTGSNDACLPLGLDAELYYHREKASHLDLYLRTTDKSPYCISN